MVYTEMTKIAMRIAYDAHKEQIDKSGVPYIYHPIHLAEQMDNEDGVCIALLHDVVEDTNISFEDLSSMGISNEVIESLKLLTHNNKTPYMEYIRQISESKNSIAKAVKIEDLKHNSDMSRLNIINDSMLARIKKYNKAIRLLSIED